MTVRLAKTDHVFMSAKTPFGEEVILTKMEGTETISDLFEFDLELCSKKNNLTFKKIVGQKITVTLTNSKGKRYFNGLVAEFRQMATVNQGTKFEHTYYKAKIVPEMWLLKLTKDCQIFQEKDAITIIKDILHKHKVTVEDKVQSCGKTKFEFCVQYNETDFDFVSRLMEAAGIFYFFKHEEGKHTLYLADHTSACSSCNTASSIDFVGAPRTSHIYGIQECELFQKMIPSEWATKDFNFETSKTNMFAHTKGTAKGGGRIYEYPGHYWDQKQKAGESITKLRIESEEAYEQSVKGSSNVPFLMQGFTFKMEKHPRKDANNVEHVLYSVTHFAQIADEVEKEKIFEGQPASGIDVAYMNRFTGLLKSTPIRPYLKTPMPKIGTQTAIVTGKESEEIWTDKYGRVKVKFHWDLGDTKNDKTSCWVRVSQGWTGNKWGMLFIPRVDQEVVVEFLNGSPDHPLIIGCVYNNENLPPYLANEPTKSTIKTNTSKGGKGFNELRFEDKKDKEEIYIHAQKDMVTEVTHDKTTTVTKGNRTITLKEGNYSTTLNKGNETKTLKDGNRTVTLEKGNETKTLKKGDQTIEVSSGKRSVTVKGGNETHTNQQNYTHEVKGNYELKVSGHLTVNVTGSITIKSGTDSITIDGMNGVTVKSTDSVTVKGTAGVNISSTASVSIKGTAGASMSGATLNLKGDAMASLKGGGMCTIKGGMVSIN
jgi:type VI secretion system secreted protein VgrG